VVLGPNGLVRESGASASSATPAREIRILQGLNICATALGSMYPSKFAPARYLPYKLQSVSANSAEQIRLWSIPRIRREFCYVF
jgi:hypothetical protein